MIANIELRFLLDQPNPLGPLQQAVSNGKIGHMKVDKHFPLVQEEREGEHQSVYTILFSGIILLRGDVDLPV